MQSRNSINESRLNNQCSKIGKRSSISKIRTSLKITTVWPWKTASSSKLSVGSTVFLVYQFNGSACKKDRETRLPSSSTCKTRRTGSPSVPLCLWVLTRPRIDSTTLFYESTIYIFSMSIQLRAGSLMRSIYCCPPRPQVHPTFPKTFRQWWKDQSHAIFTFSLRSRCFQGRSFRSRRMCSASALTKSEHSDLGIALWRRILGVCGLLVFRDHLETFSLGYARLRAGIH